MIQVQLKLKLRPAQERMLTRWLWHLTAVYNWAVRTIETHPGRLSRFQLIARLTGHSVRLGIPHAVLNGTATTAFLAWQRRFRGIANRPRLRGRRRPLNSISFAKFEGKHGDGWIRLERVGRVRFHRQDIPEGHIGTVRLVKRASGWYLCLFIHAQRQTIPRVGSGEVGIDPGFSSLLTLSTGEVIEHPNEFASQSFRLGQAQRGHRRRLAARLNERIRDRRKDRNHKLSKSLVARFDFIAFSTDNTRGMARKFGKSVVSAGHAELRQMLRYKSLAGGTEYVEVPSHNSTRLCSSCGALTGPTGFQGLTVRAWTCGCGATHDRDVNAAVNTLRFARGVRVENSREAVSGIAQ